MTAKPKQILGKSMESQETLSVERGSIHTDACFAFPIGLVGSFGSIVRILMIEMFYGGHHRSMGRSITSKLIRD